MDRTHIYNRLKAVIASHGLLLEALALSAVLGTILTTDGIPYGAHYLQRPPMVSVSSSSTNSMTLAQRRRAQRLQLQKTAKMVKSIKNVAQETKPFIAIEEEAHNAAPVPEMTIRQQADVQQAQRGGSVMHLAPPSSSASSESSVSSASAPAAFRQPAASDFPAFGHAMHPVDKTPNWGAMKTPAEWNRLHKHMSDDDFVRVPSYNLRTLMTPLNDILKNRNNPDNIKMLTEKLYYSTRFFGAYNLDAGEFTSVHPGIDLKLAEGQSIGAVAGGRVHDVRTDEDTLGLYIIIEHRAPDGRTYYSIYGHLGSAAVRTGDDITAGQHIGTIGMSGQTTGPHLHLQIDRGEPGEVSHEVYWPSSLPSAAEAENHTVHPIHFIRQYGDGQ